MKNMFNKNTMVLLILLLLTALGFMSCNEQKSVYLTGPADDPYAENSKTVQENTDNDNETAQKPLNWKFAETCTYKYNPVNGHYDGGKITFGPENSSELVIATGSILPEMNVPGENPVSIILEADYDSIRQEMMIAFKPKECYLNQPARLVIDYGSLGMTEVRLYDVQEDGRRIQICPDSFDIERRKFTKFVDTYTRFALVHSNHGRVN